MPDANGNSSIPTIGAPSMTGTAPATNELLDPISQAGRRNSFEVLSDAKLGQGAKFFRAEHLRDPHGHLMPAPAIVLAPTTASQATKLQQLMTQKNGVTVTVSSGDMGVGVLRSLFWQHW